jgi:hypothetical protein
MSAKYWVAKYIDDVFRNETQNVGVIAQIGDDVTARFIGERDDGTFDLRKLGNRFSHPQVYSQWRDYWRDNIGSSNMNEILTANSSNFFLEAAGEVSDIGEDPVSEVCEFLFDLLVGPGGVSEAYQWETDDQVEPALSEEISELFEQQRLLAHANSFLVRHPIQRKTEVRGLNAKHMPSFIQKNGALTVIEYIDMTRPQQKLVRERAGWMGYMFSDIKQANTGADTYSIVKPASDGDAVEFATNVLGKESNVVNWLDKHERELFLADRVKVADAI